MKLNRRNLFLASSATITLTLSAPVAQSADLTWDAGNTTNGTTIDALSGAWNLTDLFWNNAGTNVAWTQASTTSANNTAIFGGADGNYTITLASQMATQAITFNNSGYTIANSTLALRASGTVNGSITVAAGKTATINSAISYNNNLIANINLGANSTLNLGGGATNSQYNFNGGGTVNMTAGNYISNIGTVNVSSFNHSGGTYDISPGVNLGFSIGVADRDVNYTLSGTGILTLTNVGTNSTANGTFIAIGTSTAGFNSKLTVQGGGQLRIGLATTRAGELRIANGASSNGTFDVQGGTATVGSGNTSNQIYFFKSGADANRTAAMTQSGGNVTTNGIQFGGSGGTYNSAANATLQLSGGNLYVGAQGITKGSAAGNLTATIQLQGGTLGADQNWSSSLDMKLGTTGGGPTIRAQDSGSNARNITLSGILSNDGDVNGTLTKTGTGNLTLANANTFTGATTISDGKILMTNASALQNSAYNTTGSTGAIGLDVTGGLNTGSLKLGGLTGGVDVATAITGYGSVSGLVLNPQGTQTNSYSGIIANGSGNMTLTKTGDGTQELSGNNTYTGSTTVSAGTLIVNGSLASSVVDVTGSLAGSGVMASATLSGSGSVNPGNSPGIMTAAATDPTGGLDYNFELTQANVPPAWNLPAASINDVLRLTDATTPFTASLTGANVISLYLGVTSLSVGDTFTGGFFTDKDADFLASVSSAQFNYFLSDVSGLVTYNGFTYTAYTGAMDVSTVQVPVADFATGNVTNGYVTQFTVAIPEPRAALLGAIGLLALLRRRR